MFAACSCENNAKDVSLLIEKLKSDDPTVRANAAFYLQSVSIDNQEVIPHLAEALEDNYWLVRAEAVVALGNRCNDSNCANLISNVLVNDPNPNVREACAKVLMNIGKGAKCATPNIIIALKDDDPWVVAFSAAALGEIGPDENVVEALIDLLESINKYEGQYYYLVKTAAVKALSKFGVEAKPAIGILRELGESEAVAKIENSM